jgi:putative ABC transport system substrate-binding protein
MRRRAFITLLGNAVAWPIAARAQQPMRRIGVLMANAESDPDAQGHIQSFRTRMGNLGWRDGDNVRIDYRWAASVADRFRTAAAELVVLGPDVIVADSSASAFALQRETRSIPIVFTRVTDPVAQGLIVSLARPGGNLTGFTGYEFEIGGKWLGLLKEIAPRVTRVAAIFNPITAPASNSYLRLLQAAAPVHGFELLTMPVHDIAEIDRGIGSFARDLGGGLLVLPDPFLVTHRDRVVALCGQHRLPAIYSTEQSARGGGLLSYGYDVHAIYRATADYVDRILKGTKPADLPVQQPIKYVLVINLKTARALGLNVPATLVAQADEVIQQEYRNAK